MTDRAKAYAEAGVNIHAAGKFVSRIKTLAASTFTKGVITDIGGFGGLFKLDVNAVKEPVLAAAADGVGTKLKCAFLYDAHSTIGIDLVAMSVNDILVQGARPLFFLDYMAMGRLDTDLAEQIMQGIVAGCTEAGCALLGGETAEMPDFYKPGEYDLSGFCVGIVDNEHIVDGSGVRVGDQIIGLGSSGLHSNGYSLVRKTIAESGLGPDETFPGMKKSVRDVLLEPTKIYAKPVLALLRDLPIKAMAHITGGGFFDNIPRVLPKGVAARIQFGSWTIPRVFLWLKKTANLDWPEMLQIFNTGIGYILIVGEDIAEDVVFRLRGMKENAWIIGQIEKQEKPDSEQVLVTLDRRKIADE